MRTRVIFNHLKCYSICWSDLRTRAPNICLLGPEHTNPGTPLRSITCSRCAQAQADATYAVHVHQKTAAHRTFTGTESTPSRHPPQKLSVAVRTRARPRVMPWRLRARITAQTGDRANVWYFCVYVWAACELKSRPDCVPPCAQRCGGAGTRCDDAAAAVRERATVNANVSVAADASLLLPRKSRCPYSVLSARQHGTQAHIHTFTAPSRYVSSGPPDCARKARAHFALVRMLIVHVT